MTVLWILFGICLLLLLLSRLRFRLALGYQEDGLRAIVRLGAIRYQLYPEQKQKIKKRPPKVKNKKKVGKPKEKGTFLTQFLQDRESYRSLIQEILPPIKEFTNRFQDKLQVDIFRFTLICALEDPADAAMFYGQANAVMGATLPLLERWFTIKKKEITISLDFEREKPQLYAQAQFSLTLGQLVALGIFAMTAGLRFYKAHRGKGKNLQTPRETVKEAV